VQPGDLVDRYRIVRTVGEGGMGTVFLAEHTLIKRRVAMKVLHANLATDADVVERFLNEARAAGTLGHPNIAESTDMGFTHEHVPYIVFEYLEGALLTDEIYRLGGLPVRRAVWIARQIASALDAAHAANIVHRDLKTDNVFLTDEDAADHVKVLDFGIARILGVVERGLVMGTPEFMAPEQITSPADVDRRADLWALGVILYEMLAARRPFPFVDGNVEALLEAIVTAPPAPLGDTPPAIADLVMRLLAKDPAQRPESMTEVEAELAAFAGPTEPAVMTRRRMQSQPSLPTIDVIALPPPPRRPFAWVPVAAAALAGVIAGALGMSLLR
jgi:serine/threonine-protein kinase